MLSNRSDVARFEQMIVNDPLEWSRIALQAATCDRARRSVAQGYAE